MTSLFEAPSTSGLQQIRDQIKARALTSEQAAQKYGLQPDMMDWLGKQGISFAPNGAKPALMAAQGRNGDTSIAHVTPGETVIPKEIGQMRPDLVQHVQQAIAQYGGDPSKYTVGAGSVNPKTGIEEFATESEVRSAYKNQLGRDPEQAGLDYWMNNDEGFRNGAFDRGVQAELGGASPARLHVGQANHYTAPVADATRTMNVTPGTAGSAGTTVPGTPQAAQAATPGINVTTATKPGDITAPTGTAQGYQANTATQRPDVLAGQGTVGSYNANTVNTDNLPQVQAGTAQAYTAGPAHTYTGAQGEASLWNVDRNQTVQGQLADVIDNNSPLMQRAQARSLQQMNARGLANSSMAVGAGQSALYDAAMPIAQQDANTYSRSGEYNAGNRQAMTLANMGSSNDANRFNAGEQNQTDRFNAQLSTQNSQFNVQKALDAGIVNQEQAGKMAELNAQMINRASEFNITSDAQMQQFNIDSALKAGIINQEQANKLSMFNATSNNSAKEFTAGQSNTMTIDNNRNAMTAATANQGVSERNGQFNAGETNKMSALSANLQADVNKFNAGQSNELTKLGMDNSTRLTIANLEADNRTLLQSSTNASDVYRQMITSIAGILQNTDMDQGAKDAAIQNLVGTGRIAIQTIGKITNISLPEMNFEPLVTKSDKEAQSDKEKDSGNGSGGSGYNGPGSGNGGPGNEASSSSQGDSGISGGISA